MPFAVITDSTWSNASLEASRGVDSFQHAEDSGRYVITFDRDVSNCAWTVTQGNRNNSVWGNTAVRVAHAHSVLNGLNKVRVQIKDSNSDEVEGSFNLAITC